VTDAITRGVHHIGLTVSRLEESAAFFTSVLGWREVRRDDSHPSIFVSDGTVMVTLWQAREAPPTPFDRARNVGLHHVAFAVRSEADLDRVHRRLVEHGVPVEFAPDLMGSGPAKHMMCYEPSGIRVEFTWAGG
jgi:catechol 2,3-dioxygenase-like lactoylglutathione lyase family enzyme